MNSYCTCNHRCAASLTDRIIKAWINKRWWEILLTDMSSMLEAGISQFGLKWKRNHFQSTYPFCFVSRLSTFVCRSAWVADDSWLTHTVNQEISSKMMFGSKVTKTYNNLNIDTWLLSYEQQHILYESFSFHDESRMLKILLVHGVLSPVEISSTLYMSKVAQKWYRHFVPHLWKVKHKQGVLLHAQRWYFWTSASSVRGYGLLLWAEAGVQSGASWALTEGRGEPEVPHSGALWQDKGDASSLCRGVNSLISMRCCPGSKLLRLSFACPSLLLQLSFPEVQHQCSDQVFQSLVMQQAQQRPS